MKQALRVVLCALAALVALAAAARAELVEPAADVPAQAYRRLVFALNLNPVNWPVVRREAAVLARGLAIPATGDASARFAEALKVLDAGGPVEGRVRTPSERRATARAVFEAATSAAGKLVLARIAAVRALGAKRSFQRDEQVLVPLAWICFEPEVNVTDPAAAARLHVQPGTPTPLDELSDYLRASYGDGYRAPATGRLAPLPAGSSTFNRLAPAPLVLPPGTVLAKQVPRPRQVLNMAARGVSEAETPLIALGDMAFDSPFIFGEPARSSRIACSTCHNKGSTNPNLFVPALSERSGGMDVSNAFFAPHANDGHSGHLDIPDMRGIRFTAPYGRNGRFASLREFTRNVIVNEFNGAEPDPLLLDAMVAYFNEFDFLPNPQLKPDGTLADSAPAAARRGEKLFETPFPGMGQRACASCHVPSDHFLDRKRHDVGTVDGAGPGSRDRALDTPTLLSARWTAPYFHDGSQPTLRAVVEYFDRTFALKLSPAQLADLTAYLEVVGDGTDPYEPSPHFLAAEMEELSFFVATYEFLKSQGKLDLADTLFLTVAGELRAHVPTLQDPRHAGRMERLAVLMEEARAANRRGDAPLMDAKVAEWRKLQAESKEVLK